MEPKNGAPRPPPGTGEVLKLTADQAVLLMYLDLAAAQLGVQLEQLKRVPGMGAGVEKFWLTAIQNFQRAREHVLADLRRQVVLATPADVPPPRRH